MSSYLYRLFWFLPFCLWTAILHCKDSLQDLKTNILLASIGTILNIFFLFRFSKKKTNLHTYYWATLLMTGCSTFLVLSATVRLDLVCIMLSVVGSLWPRGETAKNLISFSKCKQKSFCDFRIIRKKTQLLKQC